MPNFEYKAIINDEVVKKTTSAKDRYTLLDDLKKGDTEVISVKEVKRSWNFGDLNNSLVKVKLRDLVIFSRNLAAMIEAGLPLSRAFSILKRQTKNAKMQKVLSSFIEDIENGRNLSDGMKDWPKVFPSVFVSMVRAGEESGGLVESLRVLGDQLEKSYNLKKKIKGAMIYPSIVLIAMFAIGIFMFIYVVPTLSSTFKAMGADLPPTTVAIIAVSDFMSANIFLSLGIIVAVVVAATIFFKSAAGKRTLDFSVLYVPKIKTIVKQSNSAYMSRTFSSLMSSGVGVIEALDITKGVVNNIYFKRVIDDAKKRVEKGEPIHVAFAENEHLYPILVAEMIEVGEETGKIADMLERLAIFYEDEVQTATKDMSQIIEPVLMLVMAIGVGFFAVSFITPIYSLSSTI